MSDRTVVATVATSMHSPISTAAQHQPVIVVGYDGSDAARAAVAVAVAAVAPGGLVRSTHAIKRHGCPSCWASQTSGPNLPTTPQRSWQRRS